MNYESKYRHVKRKPNWDYRSPGFYFVTICTKNHECFFGEIVSDQNDTVFDQNDTVSNQNDAVSDQNDTVSDQNDAVSDQNDTVSDQNDTQNFACLRGTRIGKIAGEFWMAIPQHFPFVIVDEFVIMPNHVHGILRFIEPIDGPLQQNAFGPQSKNLASVIRGFKSAVKKYATMNEIEFEWQPRYHDHVISTFNRLLIIRNYILRNPINWAKSQHNGMTRRKRS